MSGCVCVCECVCECVCVCVCVCVCLQMVCNSLANIEFKPRMVDVFSLTHSRHHKMMVSAPVDAPFLLVFCLFCFSNLLEIIQ